jgi:predicted component of type VI protein secretion system
MKLWLVVADGAHKGRKIRVTGPRFVIGRNPDCHLKPVSEAVSRRHCEILIRGVEVLLRDLGSMNGTEVNQVLLNSQEMTLSHGDRVAIGPIVFSVFIDQTSDSSPRVKNGATPNPDPEAPQDEAGIILLDDEAAAAAEADLASSQTVTPAESEPVATENAEETPAVEKTISLASEPSPAARSTATAESPSVRHRPPVSGRPRPPTSHGETSDAARDLIRKSMYRK